MNVSELRTWVDRAAGAKERAEAEYRRTVKLHNQAMLDVQAIEEAQVVVQTVARLTQKTLEYRVSELATLALSSIFPEPYGLSLSFVPARGKSEAVLSFTRDGESIPPMTAAGCGAVDVASLALRVSLLRLSRPAYRPTIILDEPLRFLSVDLMEKAADMLRKISRKLGIQFIIVTHEEELAESADKVFRVRISKGRSFVESV